jgi:hypothetical protein
VRCANTLLPDVLALLHNTLATSDEVEEYLVIVVDMFSSDTDRLPTGAAETQYRFLNVLLGGKLKYDRRAFEIGNAYLEKTYPRRVKRDD